MKIDYLVLDAKLLLINMNYIYIYIYIYTYIIFSFFRNLIDRKSLTKFLFDVAD